MKKPYYVADTGHFGIKIKVCFSDASFQQALKDSKILTRHNALDVGLAESHYIQQEGTTAAMLAIVFNFEDMAKESALERMGVIYHGSRTQLPTSLNLLVKTTKRLAMRVVLI